MDGTTLVLKSLDPVEEVVAFLRDMTGLRGYRWRALRHSVNFARRYGRRLSAVQMVAALANDALLCADRLSTAGIGSGWPRIRRGRTYITTTEPLDDVYVPAFRVASRYEPYFTPTMITDETGDVTMEIADSGVLDRAAGRSCL